MLTCLQVKIMNQLTQEACFATFLIIATGLIIGQHSAYGLFLYICFVSFVGLMTWVSIKLGLDEDDEEHHS